MSNFEEGMAVATLTYSTESVAKDGGNLRKDIMRNEAYEVMQDELTGEFIVRVGNHLGTLGRLDK